MRRDVSRPEGRKTLPRGWLTGVLLLAAGAVLLPWMPGAGLFAFVPVPPAVLATVLAITVAYIAASELAKRRFTIP
jgi:Mg2+-importing ATPase